MGQTLKCPSCGSRSGNTNSNGGVHLKTRSIYMSSDGKVIGFCKQCQNSFVVVRTNKQWRLRLLPQMMSWRENVDT